MSVCCQCRSCTELCSRHVIGYPVEPHLVMRVLSNGGKGDAQVLLNSMFCSSCGLCETYSCPQDLSPRAMIDEIKRLARQNGIKPPENVKPATVKDSDLKKVSVARLTSRLGLKKYDVPAPMLHEGFIPPSVKIMMSQHLGTPAVPCVKEGDEVKRGDVIGRVPDKALGVNIHASINGKVTVVTPKYIKIN